MQHESTTTAVVMLMRVPTSFTSNLPTPRRWLAGSLALLVVLGCGCAGDGSDGDGSEISPDTADTTLDDRQIYRSDEVEGVVAVVADCFVIEDAEGAARYSTTVEVRNTSTSTHAVAVVIDADEGRGGTSDIFDIPGGGTDAWAVVGDDTTNDPVGDVECTDFINAISVDVDG